MGGLLADSKGGKIDAIVHMGDHACKIHRSTAQIHSACNA